jgi:hypothetical protein
MLRRHPSTRGWRRVVLLACSMLAALLSVGAFASAAYAGDWIQVSCMNPNGSAASSEGWSSFSTGGPGYGSNSGTNCSPSAPMYAILSSVDGASVGSGENLQYSPPAGSTLAGGSVDVSLSADGSGYNASGTAVLYSPAFAYNGSNVFFQCAAGLLPCFDGTNDFSGTITLPSNRGGGLFIGAGCGGNPGATCDVGGTDGTWAFADLFSADLLLNNTSSPTASGFTGTLLSPGAHGTASLTFTAGDPSGPGVYKVIVSIDGKSAYDATPNTNGGDCASAGTDSGSGAWMFDWQQPCLQTETVDVPINTTAFADGEHELTVQVEDAAQNTSTVLDQEITTANLTTVSSLLPTSLSSTSAPGPLYGFVLDKATSALGTKVSRSYDHSALTLSGTLNTAAGAIAPGVTVALWASPAAGSTFSVLTQTTTDGAGRWVLRAPAGASRVLRVVAGVGAQPATSPSAVSVNEAVTPSLSLHVATPGKATLVFTGRLAITPLGTPRPQILVEVRAPRGWQAVGAPVRVDASGRFRYVYPSSALLIGHRFVFRVTTPATSSWGAAVSRVREAVLR